MKIENHWLVQATQVPTTNFDSRPFDDISLIVIHCISLPPYQYGNNYIDQLFCNQLNAVEHPYFKQIAEVKVSAHLLIKRDGSITQYVAFNKRAWHAGHSEYQGCKKCNDFSIGIELEGCETEAYTDRQYTQLIAVVKVLLAYYPSLSPHHIVGHSDIAPGRKTDPGESFIWKNLLSAL